MRTQLVQDLFDNYLQARASLPSPHEEPKPDMPAYYFDVDAGAYRLVVENQEHIYEVYPPKFISNWKGDARESAVRRRLGEFWNSEKAYELRRDHSEAVNAWLEKQPLTAREQGFVLWMLTYRAGMKALPTEAEQNEFADCMEAFYVDGLVRKSLKNLLSNFEEH
jgi:hypothetical protein